MPVRKIPKNYRNVTGIAAHAKADGPAAYESTLERDFITLLEFSPGPMMSRDNLRSMQQSNVCPAGCTLPFGLVPQALEAIAPAYLGQGDPRERYPQLRWRARR